MHVCIFIKIELEATMGDEDWEAEIIKPHMSSYVPVFEKVLKFTVIQCYSYIKVENHCDGEILNYIICVSKLWLSPCDCH